MKIAILGASRGLGRELALEIQQQIPSSELLLMSRKFDLLSTLARPTDKVASCDFCTREGQVAAIQALENFEPQLIYYVAGGGPYGVYGEKDWMSHEWALNVTFLFPARVLHWAAENKPKSLKKIIVVGSQIAENQPDPHAASYAAAKHGLRGLVQTLQLEGFPYELELFSPGYMATDLLPQNSAPRERGLAADPREVAKSLLNFSEVR
jgi:short-subunit dehydrogenase